MKKNQNKKILIIYEYNNKTGGGHFGRSKNIFKNLKKKYPSTSIKNIKNIKQKILDNYDYYIFDIKNYNNNFYRYASKKKNSILTIENFQNNLSKYNLSIYDHNSSIKNVRYKGLHFAPIDKRLNVKRIVKKDTIFIFLGSVYKKKIQLKKIVNSIDYTKYKVIISPLNKISKFKNQKIKFSSKRNWIKYFKNSEYCILSGGVTLLEALFMKKKCFVIPQNNLENTFSRYLLKKKYIISNEIAHSINFFKNNSNISKKIKVAKEIDKNGSNKIVTIFEKKILKK